MDTKLIVGTVILNMMFFLAGIDKVLHFSKVVDGLIKRLSFVSLPIIVYQLAIVIAIIIEVLSPMIILFGSIYRSKFNDRNCVFACYALILFTILVTLVYHFPPLKSIKYYPFMSNLTTIGGLYLTSILFKTN